MFGICFLFGGGRVGSVSVGCVDGGITNPSDMRGSKERHQQEKEVYIYVPLSLPFLRERLHNAGSSSHVQRRQQVQAGQGSR